MRRKTKASANQFDLFASVEPARIAPPPKSVQAKRAAPDRNPAVSPKAEARAFNTSHRMERPEKDYARDEWWTTDMVCNFLKISRKTLWDRRKKRELDFPKPASLGGSRNLYRASAIRAWANAMA